MSQAFSETAAGRVQNVILGSQGFSQEADSVLQPQGYLMMSGPKDMIRGLLWQPSCSSWQSELSWGCSSVGEPNEASSAWSHRFDYMALLCPSLLDAASAAMTSRHSRKTVLGLCCRYTSISAAGFQETGPGLFHGNSHCIVGRTTLH